MTANPPHLRHAVPAAFAALLAFSAPAAATGNVVHLKMPPRHAASPTGKVVERSGPSGVWTARCVSDGRTQVPDCSIESRTMLKDSGKLLAAVTVSVRHGSNTATMLVQVPLGLALDKAIVLTLDKHPPARLRVQTCDQSGCYGATVLSAQFLGAMRAARRLDVRVVGTDGRPIVVPMSLAGFSAAYDRIK